MGNKVTGLVISLLLLLSLSNLATFRVVATTDNNAGYTFTPAGWRLVSCVHLVPSASTVLDNGSVMFPDGTVVSFPYCPPVNQADFPSTGWIEMGQAHQNGITTFTGDWHAQSNPPSYVGQTVFLWNGLQSNFTTKSSLVQSVLSYGPTTYYGGNYWALASWYCPPNSGTCIASSPLSVTAGDWLNGQQYWYNNQWWVLSQDVSTGHLTYLTISHAFTYNYAIVQLEDIQVTACNQYPGSPTTFTKLAFQNGVPPPSWTSSIHINDGCGEKVVITGSSQVALYY